MGGKKKPKGSAIKNKKGTARAKTHVGGRAGVAPLNDFRSGHFNGPAQGSGTQYNTFVQQYAPVPTAFTEALHEVASPQVPRPTAGRHVLRRWGLLVVGIVIALTGIAMAPTGSWYQGMLPPQSGTAPTTPTSAMPSHSSASPSPSDSSTPPPTTTATNTDRSAPPTTLHPGTSAPPAPASPPASSTEAAPTAKANTPLTCSGWRYSNSDMDDGYLAYGGNMKAGPYAACDSYRAVTPGMRVYYWCSVTNNYGTSWTYARIAGSTWQGWLSGDTLDDGGSTIPCPKATPTAQ